MVPRVATLFLVSAAVLLTGCSDSRNDQRAIGKAYVGPMELIIRKEISPKSPPSAKAKHGDTLEILGRRRRFVKVRTGDGVVGWADMYQLLGDEQMKQLDVLAETAQQLPSHGKAGVYEPLNVHTEANRQAPSFYRIREGETVDVITHQPVPRVAFKRGQILPRAEPKKVARKKEAKYPPPPMPAAPKPPDNLLELSKTTMGEEVKPPEKPVPLDDWTLVRLQTGRAGWVLTGNLRMNIPDEVAQYSEGNRITSYFPMLEVQDGGQTRHHWLWTTLSKIKQPWHFDSFRYFIWNTRRHRYETAYVERGVRGYFPVEIHTVQMTVGKKAETFPGFALIIEEADGQRYKKTYAYQYYRVVLADKQKVEASADTGEDETVVPGLPPAPKKDGWLAQIKGLKRKWFGK
ncbi:MAG TPA: SH3 domain-containing protein [Bryobacteraceae bacterium]|nr:SH3 domain-containing protein [Bryobacteraceae bacterium]